MKIGIIGTGAFSTSIALLLASDKNKNITMWSENEKLVESFLETKKLNTIFKDKSIPKNIKVTNNYEETLKEADVVFLLTSINYLNDVCKDIKHLISPNIPVYIGTKGIAANSKKFVPEIVTKHLKNKIALFGGPTFANDVVAIDPIGFVIASKDKKCRAIFKSLFATNNVRIEESSDLNGVALCSCLKNIYAIGSGIISGLKYHESTNALYLTYVYQELFNILYKMNSSLETLNGLGGLGDLILTCNSPQSRNYSYGEKVAKKTSKTALEKYLKENTVEGLNTLEAIYPMFKRKHLKCPIIYSLYSILYQDENPQKLIDLIIKKG